VHTWKHPGDGFIAYLTAITGWGHEPSDIEQTLLKSAKKPR